MEKTLVYSYNTTCLRFEMELIHTRFKSILTVKVERKNEGNKKFPSLMI